MLSGKLYQDYIWMYEMTYKTVPNVVNHAHTYLFGVSGYVYRQDATKQMYLPSVPINTYNEE